MLFLCWPAVADDLFGGQKKSMGDGLDIKKSLPQAGGQGDWEK